MYFNQRLPIHFIYLIRLNVLIYASLRLVVPPSLNLIGSLGKRSSLFFHYRNADKCEKLNNNNSKKHPILRVSHHALPDILDETSQCTAVVFNWFIAIFLVCAICWIYIVKNLFRLDFIFLVSDRHWNIIVHRSAGKPHKPQLIEFCINIYWGLNS